MEWLTSLGSTLSQFLVQAPAWIHLTLGRAIAEALREAIAWCLMWIVDRVANRAAGVISQQRNRRTKVDHHG